MVNTSTLMLMVAGLRVAVTNTDGSRSFYHWNTGDKLVSTFFATGHDRWYYADDRGNVVTGAQVINGQKLFFDTDGKQVKGAFGNKCEW